MTDIKVGDILVAHPALLDPAFAKSVILIANRDGSSIGVNIAKSFLGDRLLLGGPMDGGGVLHPLKESVDGSKPIGETGLAFTRLSIDATGNLQPVRLIGGQANIVLMGYAAWSNSQLSMEIEMGAWSITKESLDSLLRIAPEQRWEQAAKTCSFMS